MLQMWQLGGTKLVRWRRWCEVVLRASHRYDDPIGQSHHHRVGKARRLLAFGWHCGVLLIEGFGRDFADSAPVCFGYGVYSAVRTKIVHILGALR
jgi:hypothetical protein